MAITSYRPFFVRENTERYTSVYYNELLNKNKEIKSKPKPKKKVEQFYENPKIKEDFF